MGRYQSGRRGGINAVEGGVDQGNHSVGCSPGLGIRVLGPTRVEGTQRLSPQARVVLGVLVSTSGRSVSPDQLADALWADAQPESWRKIVQGVIVRLRKTLGHEAIETTTAGYRLALATDDVDAWRFADLVGRARRLMGLGELDLVVPVLDEALDLWDGDPLEELGRWSPALGEIAQLQQLRRSAEECRLEALVGLGHDDEAVATASRLTAAEPLRERLWELLALALYRSGHQADALRSLAQARHILRDELGVEPGPHLGALERAILHHEPTLSGGLQPTHPVSEGQHSVAASPTGIILSQDSAEQNRGRRLDAAGVWAVAFADEFTRIQPPSFDACRSTQDCELQSCRQIARRLRLQMSVLAAVALLAVGVAIGLAIANFGAGVHR